MTKINPHRIFMSVVQSVKRLADAYLVVVTENATLKEDLAEALENDPASEIEIEAAKAEATAAKAKVAELQALVDADTLEDADIQALVDSALPMEPPTV